MIVIIQCAASKQSDAGYLKMRDGRSVLFVSKPELAPNVENFVYARPDDLSDSGQSWRAELLRYNQNPGNNAFGLLPAYELYSRDVYRHLVARFGLNNVFILSAGWGLISASFLTPAYDITFSAAAESYKHRLKRERYDDLQMLPADRSDEIVFLGGKDYLPLFCELTQNLSGPKTVFYNSKTLPDAPGCLLQRFTTSTRTNWHYECANSLLLGKLAVE